MKNIVTVYFGDDWDKEVPFKSPFTRKAFELWHEKALDRKVAMYRASLRWYDKDKNVFTKAWAFRDDKWQKVVQPIRPDLIYDKVSGKHDYCLYGDKMEIARHVRMYNHPLFRTLTNNKVAQCMLFSQYMPAFFIAVDKAELHAKADSLKSSKLVIKPVYGSGGEGIVIAPKDEALRNSYEYPVLVQEFIESNRGIPGFSKKEEVSDLRLVYTDHKLTYALSRIAKSGSLFTNFHQGATGIIVPAKSIPTEAENIAHAIVGKLQVFSRAQYSLDFIFDNDGKPYLIEMNTTPGLDLITELGTEKLKEKNLADMISVLG